PTCSHAYASPTPLLGSSQGLLPAQAGSPLAGRVLHPLDDRRSFMKLSHPHSLSTRIAWSHCFSYPPTGTVVPAALRPPQALRGESCPLDQPLELSPHDGRMLALVHRPLGKPTVGPGHDSLSAHHASEVYNSLRHRFGMLDHCSGMRDDAGNEHLALGQLHVFPHAPLIRMAGVRCLHRVGLGLDPE